MSKKTSGGRFRSYVLRVMGPARFLCATPLLAVGTGPVCQPYSSLSPFRLGVWICVLPFGPRHPPEPDDPGRCPTPDGFLNRAFVCCWGGGSSSLLGRTHGRHFAQHRLPEPDHPYCVGQKQIYS